MSKLWQSKQILRASNKGFTLIELLIVVAIIAILAAIAVPNFLEAQTRAKVAEVKSEMATLTTALEAYAVDNNKYPQIDNPFGDVTARLQPLTTPISYISELPLEPFERDTNGFFGFGSLEDPTGKNYVYQTANNNFGFGNQNPESVARFGWSLTSGGPDRVLEFPYYAIGSNFITPAGRHMNFIYDATNGSISPGEIFRRGGGYGEPIAGIDGY